MVGTAAMEHDIEKFDGVVLALLRLNSFTDHGETRAWKGFDWDVLTRFVAEYRGSLRRSPPQEERRP
jgi:hypothetical protein